MHADPLTTTLPELLAAQALPPEQARTLLRGRRLGLMGAATGSAAALRFRRAAEALGAEVSDIPARLEASAEPRELEATARLLGRLYDAVECQGMDAGLVRRLRAAASIPVYAELAGEANPVTALAPELPGEAPLEDKRRWALQAMLLRTIAR